jgi:two-component system, chemotaxis family, CheB/CheR fusion protein
MDHSENPQPIMKNLVIIGASAGGLKALEKLVKTLPESTDCAFVIIQHLSPDFKSLMAEILKVHTKLPVQEVSEGMKLEKDHIYLIPPGFSMILDDDKFCLKKRDSKRETTVLPINTFMVPAAINYGSKCIGMILSGTGFDGTKGCKAIKESGGLVLAQNPDSAEFNSMPQSIINSKLAHLILEPEKTWGVINNYDNNPVSVMNYIDDEEEKTEVEKSLNIEYKSLFGFLKNIFQLDFSNYKIKSVSRRIARRMQINGIRDINEYLSLLKSNTEETNDLYRDLLIGVTSFFRDPEIYAELKEKVLSPIFLSDSPPKQFRLWIAGCANGEEAYSFAILTDELANECRYPGKISIFATDMHIDSVHKASKGLYSKEELSHLSEERKEKYFKLIEGEQYRIRPDIRQRIVFAQHNLLEDPPFTNMDFVSCRNMLIYFKEKAQKIALHSLSYATRLNGHLLLGSSEAISHEENNFECLSTHGKIFKKIRDSKDYSKSTHLFSKPINRETLSSYDFNNKKKITSINSDLLSVYDSLLKEFVPSGVLINQEREVQHYFGDCSKYLLPKRGRVSNDFFSQLPDDLKLTVSLGVQKVQQGHHPLEKGPYTATSRYDDEMVKVRISQFKVDETQTDMLLVLLEPYAQEQEEALLPQSKGVETNESTTSVEAQERIFMLEDELRSTKENLQNTVEELQTSNEELQAINEEIQVSNEELQSTNEELHSMNEELHSVNAELQEKNEQLIELNNDHESLLDSTEDGVLFLDHQLRIKRFNRQISFAFDLLHQDIGRPIEHIHYKPNDHDLMLQDVHEVLATGKNRQRKSVTKDGVYFMRRFTPFYNHNKQLSGVVLTFTDISEINSLRGRLQMALNAAKMVWWEWDLEKDFLTVHNDDGNCILGYDCDSIQPSSRFWFDQLHPDDVKRVKASLDRCLQDLDEQWSSEHRYVRGQSSQYAWVREVGQVIARDEDGKALRMSGTTMNIDGHKKQEVELIAAKDYSEKAERAKSSFLSHMSHEIRTPLNGIIGMAEMLNESKAVIPETLTENIDTIFESSKILYDLINNILDFSKAESGQLELHQDWSDLKKEILLIEKIFEIQCQDKDLTLSVNLDLKNKFYFVDLLRLQQILINLISNAIKFSDQGGHVNLTVNSNATRLYFSVEDEGIGMTEEQVARLFKPFSQADSSITKYFGGTGLGLSISAQLVRIMHGGDIKVKSEKDKGSKFSFEISSRGSNEMALRKERVIQNTFDAIPELKKVLIVDDNFINLKTLKKIVERADLECDCASSGKEALEFLKKHKYDLLLLDIHMPEMSGFSVAEIVRDNEDLQLNRETVIFACTADSDDHMREEVRKARMNDTVFKPIRKNDLFKVIARHFIFQK